MQLRPEYEKIRSDVVYMAMLGSGYSYSEAIREAVERCQALADRPPKELTDAELEKLWKEREVHHPSPWAFARAMIAAHIAKQKEPEVVKVNVSVYRNPNGAIIVRGDNDAIDVGAKLLKTETLEVPL